MLSQSPVHPTPADADSKRGYNAFLLLVSGLGGLLYGVDVGIISGALPYLEATSGFNAGQLSFIVAAVLLGSVISTLFAGLLADWLGRKWLMALSGVLFVVSIPVIAVSQGYGALLVGRLLQGISAGLIGVVVPLYLAECLGASNRGKGTGVFQWMLTLGIVAAAVIGMYFSVRVDAVAKLNDAAQLLRFKDHAWRSIFWVSLPPGVLFVIGAVLVAESPRWLFRKGQLERARIALLRSRSEAQAEIEFAEMQAAAQTQAGSPVKSARRDSLFSRRYVIPFILACVILACNQATGVNSILGYSTNILLQGGLSDVQAHTGNLILTVVNFIVTMAGVVLVDRIGRKLLLSLGSGGIILCLLTVGLLFRQTEAQRIDYRAAIPITNQQTASVTFDSATARQWAAASGKTAPTGASTLTIIYSYGGFRTATKAVRSDDPAPTPLQLTRENCLPANAVVAFFSNPFADLAAARTAPLKIEAALVSPIPSTSHGWLTALSIFGFMAFFAVGPGVCVWLALSELMPTRIRSNGMSIALLINQAVSTGIAGLFLPTVATHGYSTVFFGFAGCTVIYFVTAAFILPETKGKTLEEIEALFSRRTSR